MELEMIKTSDLKPYANNPRDNDAAVDAVAQSIQRFGFRQPIVIDGDGVIVCGHTRWKAAQRLRLENVPVHVARDLTPEQTNAYRLSDNRTSEISEWNMDKIIVELGGLDLHDGLPGFTRDELNGLLVTPVDDVPDTVRQNLDELKTMRRTGNDAVVTKHDTEKYVVVVFQSRTEKEIALRTLGLAAETRYVDAHEYSIQKNGSSNFDPTAMGVGAGHGDHAAGVS